MLLLTEDWERSRGSEIATVTPELAWQTYILPQISLFFSHTRTHTHTRIHTHTHTPQNTCTTISTFVFSWLLPTTSISNHVEFWGVVWLHTTGCDRQVLHHSQTLQYDMSKMICFDLGTSSSRAGSHAPILPISFLHLILWSVHSCNTQVREIISSGMGRYHVYVSHACKMEFRSDSKNGNLYPHLYSILINSEHSTQ